MVGKTYSYDHNFCSKSSALRSIPKSRIGLHGLNPFKSQLVYFSFLSRGTYTGINQLSVDHSELFFVFCIRDFMLTLEVSGTPECITLYYGLS